MPSSNPQARPPFEERQPASVSRSALRHLRRLVIGVIGLTVLAIGVAMDLLVTPAMLGIWEKLSPMRTQ